MVSFVLHRNLSLYEGSPDKRYYSKKFNGPGYRYEVALSILSSDIVWIAGPYFPGEWNDIKIFRHGLMHELDDGERVEADDGYWGECPMYCKCPRKLPKEERKRMTGRLRMRHETVNERFKNFSCMASRFRHGGKKHAACFRAVVVLTQLAIESGEELFDMREYNDNLTDEQVVTLFGL